MSGYYDGAASQTEEVLKIHEDGKMWVHTGDIGHIDENGCLFIDGRIKRMFVREGYKVFPGAIEVVINGHEMIKECAVVAKKSRRYGYISKAYLVLKQPMDVDSVCEEIRDLCKNHLYTYEVPDEYEVLEQLPRTNVGKINYLLLEEKTLTIEKED